MFVLLLLPLLLADTYTATFEVSDGLWDGGTVVDGVLWLRDESSTFRTGDMASFDAVVLARVGPEGESLSFTVGDQVWLADYAPGGAITMGDGLQGFPYGHRTWETEPEPVISPVDDDAGYWEGAGTSHCEVYHDGETWFLYWTGAMSSGYAYRQIGLATSLDALTWTRYTGNPILTIDYSHDTVDGIHKHMPTVIVDGGGTWHMYFACYQNDVGNRICHATSEDAYEWTAPDLDEGYVALDMGGEGEFDSDGLREPDLSIAEDGTWYLFYNGTQDGEHYGPTGLASSADGWGWKKLGAVTDGESQLQGGSVVQSEWGLEQWYQCWSSICFARAEPEDWSSWTIYGDEPVLEGGWAEWNDGYVQAPSVWRTDDGSYHMWFNAYSYAHTGYEVLGHAATRPDPGQWLELRATWDGETLRVIFDDGQALEAPLDAAAALEFSAVGTAEIEEFSISWEPLLAGPGDTGQEETGIPDTGGSVVGAETGAGGPGDSPRDSGSGAAAPGGAAGCGCSSAPCRLGGWLVVLAVFPLARRYRGGRVLAGTGRGCFPGTVGKRQPKAVGSCRSEGRQARNDRNG